MTDETSSRALRRLLNAPRLVPHVEEAVWLGLLRSYLDAEHRAVAIVGDYLEDIGQPRIKPGNDEKRLQRVLTMLPVALAHEVACDFVDHVVEARPAQEASALIRAKRAWLAERLSDAQLKAARESCAKRARPRGGLHIGPCRYRAAMHAASTSPRPHVAGMAAAECVKVAPRGELAWQMAHLAARLEAAGAAPW